MIYATLLCLLSMCLLASIAITAPATPANPNGAGNPATPATPNPGTTCDHPEHLTAAGAIRKGCDYLLAHQNDDGSWASLSFHKGTSPTVLTSMATYALMEVGYPASDERISKALDWLKANYAGDNATYTLGFRAHAWLLANRSTKGKFTSVAQKDLHMVVKSTSTGAYNYICSGKPFVGRWDNSNSQYGLYAAWAAASYSPSGKTKLNGVSTAYWNKVLQHWVLQQNRDGGWGYTAKKKTTMLMTQAGLASLFVCEKASPNSKTSPEAGIREGLAWLNANYPACDADPASYGITGWKIYYHYFGMQRIAMASGIKRFGGKAWFTTAKTDLLASQAADGSWPGSGIGKTQKTNITSTAWALMVLARASRPLPFMSMDYLSGDCPGEHRVGLQNLLAYFEQELEQPLQWQDVSVKSREADWTESEMILLPAARAGRLAKTDKWKAFLQAGGAFLIHGEEGAKTMEELLKADYPELTVVKLDKNHRLAKSPYKLKSTKGVTLVLNGETVLAVCTEESFRETWKNKDFKKNPDSFQLPLNLYFLAKEQAKAAAAAKKDAPTDPDDLNAQPDDWDDDKPGNGNGKDKDKGF